MLHRFAVNDQGALEEFALQLFREHFNYEDVVVALEDEKGLSREEAMTLADEAEQRHIGNIELKQEDATRDVETPQDTDNAVYPNNMTDYSDQRDWGPREVFQLGYPTVKTPDNVAQN